MIMPTPITSTNAHLMGPSSPGYSCAQCGKVHILTSRDTVRCTKCGYRIMFKLRTTQPILTVAR